MRSLCSPAHWAIANISLSVAIFTAEFTPLRAQTIDGSATELWRKMPGNSFDHRFEAMGNFDVLSHAVNGGKIEIGVSSGQLLAPKTELLRWIDDAVAAVEGYYGKFPVPQLTLAVLVDDGDGIHAGNERGGKLITIKLGAGSRSADFADDWHLTHEFFHLGFPDVPERYHWMEEGLSTYLEPLARARVGQLTAERVWKDMVEGMPQGLPKTGDRGLDRTPTWGRTYWGGALFWLLADVEIRERTNNRRSLDDAIRGVWSEGGDGSADWSAERVWKEGDRATGLSVLASLHEKMGEKPGDVDLPALWKRLGVVYAHGRVTFDDSAPLANVRKALTDRANLYKAGFHR
jgi:hypothetical protein